MHKTKAAGISRMGTRRPHNAAKYALSSNRIADSLDHLRDATGDERAVALETTCWPAA